MLNYRIKHLAYIGGLAFSLYANTTQKRLWHYVAGPDISKLGNLVEPNTGNRAALYSWVDEGKHTTTLLVGTKNLRGDHCIRKMVYSLSQPGTPEYSLPFTIGNELIPRNIFRSPEGVVYLIANNGNKGNDRKGGVWASLDNGTSWEKVGNHINDGHIAFYTKLLNNQKTTIIRVGVPGRESTEIVVTDIDSALENYKEEIQYSGCFDPKSISSKDQFRVYKVASFTTVSDGATGSVAADSSATEQVGEVVVGHDGAIQYGLPILSAKMVRTEVEPTEPVGCRDALVINKIDLKKMVTNLEAAKTKNCERLCGELNFYKENPMYFKLQAFYDKQIEYVNKIIKYSYDNTSSNDPNSLPALREEKDKIHNNELGILQNSKSALEALIEASKKVGCSNVSKFKAFIDEYKTELTKVEQQITDKKQEIDNHASTMVDACDKTPDPTFVQQLEMNLLGQKCDYNRCVATYDNSGFIVSADKGNTTVSDVLNCNPVNHDTQIFTHHSYSQPQEVIAQSDGSMAVVSGGNHIDISTDKSVSGDCQNIKNTSFYKCKTERVMITGVHPTLCLSDDATTKNPPYNGMFLALGQHSETKTASLGLYMAPIATEISNKYCWLSKNEIHGKLTGEPTAKVIWWLQKKASNSDSYDDIPAVDNNKKNVITIKLDNNKTLTVYIGELDKQGKKEILINNNIGRKEAYRLMASTVVGGFVCDRMNNDPGKILSSTYKNIGVSTKDVSLIANVANGLKVDNSDSLCPRDKNVWQVDNIKKVINDPEKNSPVNSEIVNTNENDSEDLKGYNEETKKFIQDVKNEISVIQKETANSTNNANQRVINNINVNGSNNSFTSKQTVDTNVTQTLSQASTNAIKNEIKEIVRSALDKYVESCNENESDEKLTEGATKAIIEKLATNKDKLVGLAKVINQPQVVSKVIDQVIEEEIQKPKKHHGIWKKLEKIGKDIVRKGVLTVGKEVVKRFIPVSGKIVDKYVDPFIKKITKAK
jgi:hypothetical protein